MTSSRMIASLFALLLALPAWAQDPEVHPTDPDSSTPVTLIVTDGAPTNGCDLAEASAPVVSRQGNRISIEYALLRTDESDAPPGSLCLSAHVPAFFHVALGRLPAGSYEVTVNGTFDGVARTPQSTVFTVRAFSGLVTVPVDSDWAVALIVLALAGVAGWRLRVH